MGNCYRIFFLKKMEISRTGLLRRTSRKVVRKMKWPCLLLSLRVIKKRKFVVVLNETKMSLLKTLFKNIDYTFNTMCDIVASSSEETKI